MLIPPGHCLDQRCDTDERPFCVRLPKALSAPLKSREDHGRTKEKDLEVEESQPSCFQLDAQGLPAQRVPPMQRREASPCGLWQLWLVRRPSSY